MWSGQSYADRVQAEVCVQCPAPAAPGSDRCEPHRDAQRKRDATWRRSKRQANRKLKLCAECPTPSESYYCPVCAIRAGRVPVAAVDSAVDKRSRIDNRTKTDSTGRTRYHGRGRRAAPESDAAALVEARRLLLLCERGLEMARSVTELSAVQQRAAVHAALAHADRASRLIEELCTRNGYSQQRLAADLDE